MLLSCSNKITTKTYTNSSKKLIIGKFIVTKIPVSFLNIFCLDKKAATVTGTSL